MRGVDVARSCEFQFLETFDGSDSGDDFLGDFARRLAQFLGKVEGQGERVLTEFDPRGLFDDDAGQLERISATDEIA